MSKREINNSIAEKEQILRWLVRHRVNNIDAVGEVIANYYTDKEFLMKFVRKNKPLGW